MEKISSGPKLKYERILCDQPNNVKYIVNFSILEGMIVLVKESLFFSGMILYL